ncbi:alpha-1,2-fucosyltransferase [Sulfitobacter delicatus]|uniref:Glycosyl transferase family 11 n=1 Tax=Sulfitobacter delicatus TaxID=218672 RepID=A0A1G7W6K7_9RHOB|nr:alpha-1,2-fucosyltransferase [Sulfitobacter delicatus]SDG67556.1 Glycosyl transferase family 11 [Sulfitobacter delicatus]
MIYSRLHGRLGNQMFQYAAGAALARRVGVPLALDWRRADAKGEGRLTDIFDLPVAKPERMPPGQDARPLAYAAWRLLGRRPKFRREKGLGYNPAFETWGDEIYLHGYWQSQRYFENIRDHLHEVFTVVPPMSPANAEMAARIASVPSVALHVRRGDYVALGATAACDQAYYDRALAAVADGLGQPPTVFVFSDDPNWARDNLEVPFEKVIVDLNGPDTAHEDMRLMSLCQHNIIANSTFSWWSAWLNTTPGKRVVAPTRWVLNADQHNPDILPEDWIAV